MRTISDAAWRSVPETLRKAILRQVARADVVGKSPESVQIDDHLRNQLVTILSTRQTRSRITTGTTTQTTRASGKIEALEWWATLTSAERGKYINWVYTDVVQSS